MGSLTLVFPDAHCLGSIAFLNRYRWIYSRVIGRRRCGNLAYDLSDRGRRLGSLQFPMVFPWDWRGWSTVCGVQLYLKSSARWGFSGVRYSIVQGSEFPAPQIRKGRRRCGGPRALICWICFATGSERWANYWMTYVLCEAINA